MNPGQQQLHNLTKALQNVLLSPLEQQDKERKDYFEEQNYKAAQKLLNELQVPQELRNHIPSAPGNHLKLSTEALKEHRNEFKLHKALPQAAKFKTGNRNRKLGDSIRKTAERFQNNSKHTLGAAIEIATSLSKTGQRLRDRIDLHTRIPAFIRDHIRKIQETKRAYPQDIEKFIESIDAEFNKYQETLSELSIIYKKLHSLVFLESDALADGLQQLKNICLSLRNLQAPRDNVFPTRQEYQQAIRERGYPGRFYSRRGRGHRGSYRGRFNRRGSRFQGRHRFTPNNYNNNNNYPAGANNGRYQ